MDRRLQRTRRPNRWLLIGLGVTLAVVVAFVTLRLMPPANALQVEADNLRNGLVRQAPFRDYLPLRAEVSPLMTVVVSAVAGGQVARAEVSDGAYVSAGDVLATLSNPQLRLEVSAREAEISSRLSDNSAQRLNLERNQLDQDRQLAETNYQLLRARREFGVRTTLRDKGLVAAAGVEPYAAEVQYYQTRLADLTAARRQQRSVSATQETQIADTAARLKRNLSEVQGSLEALVIRAPMSGRLTNFALQPGQTLKAGDEVGQLGSEGTYKLIAQVDEYYLGRLSAGQAAQADVAGRPTRLAVSRVIPRVVNGRFASELAFPGPPPSGLRRGQSIDIRITLGDTKTAIVAPYGAWVESGGGAYAFVLEPNGRRAVRRPISIGRRNPQEVEILDGLKPGDRLITSTYGGYEKFSTLILR